MIVIAATNIGVGGGITHLIEIIKYFATHKPNTELVVFASNRYLVKLPDYEFLKKRTHYLLNKTLLHRLIFQIFVFDKLIPDNAILFSVTGDFLGSYKPMIGMSRNMLLYQREHWKKMDVKAKLRLLYSYLRQKRCFKQANAVIFISNHSKDTINKKFSFLKSKQQTLIHHGVSQMFRFEVKPQLPVSSYSFSNPILFNYISTIHTYKNQLAVIKAFYELRKLNYPVYINFIGEIINNSSGRNFRKALRRYDPDSLFSCYHGNIPYEEVHTFYEKCDAVLFASSCETMPNIVMEAMISGRPLACSNTETIKEFTKENAFFFDPEDADSIKNSVIKFINNPEQREQNAIKAQQEALQYSWKDAAEETVEFVNKIFQEFHS